MVILVSTSVVAMDEDIFSFAMTCGFRRDRGRE